MSKQSAQRRRLTPDGLASLLAKLRDQGVPVERATLAPDGTLDLLLKPGEGSDPFDLVDMKR
jgi:uncharacterized membrane protein YcaP (DUF421 family)